MSSEQMGQRMSGRKMIKIPRIPSRIRGDDIEGDWVTIGVIVDKLPPRYDILQMFVIIDLFLGFSAFQNNNINI